MIVCPKCQSANEDNSKKCVKCNIDLEKIFICSNCEKTYTQWNKMCDECNEAIIPIKEFNLIKKNLKNGNILYEHDYYIDAIENYDNGLEIVPNNEALLINKAKCQYLINEKKEAEETLDKILKLDVKKLYGNILKSNYYVSLEEIEKSINCLNEIMEYDDDGKIILNKIGILIHNNQIDKARRALREGCEKFPENEILKEFKQIYDFERDPDIEFNEYIIEKLENEEKLNWDSGNNIKLNNINNEDDLIELIDEIFQKTINEDSEETIIKKIDFFDSIRDFERKEFYENKGLELYPESVEINLKISEKYLADTNMEYLNDTYIEDYEKAEKYINTAYKADPNNEKVLSYKSLIYLYHDLDPEKAIEFGFKTININPENRIGLRSIAEGLQNVGEPEYALEYLERYLYLYPEDMEQQYSKVLLLERLNEEEESEKYHIMMIEKYGDKYESYVEYFETMMNTPIKFYSENENNMEKETIEEHFELTNKLLENDPDNIKFIVRKGEILAKIGKYDEALEYFEKRLKDSEKEMFLYGKAFVFDKKGNHKKALKLINKSLKLNSTNPNIYHLKGDILHSLGRYKKAIEEYDKALELNPENEYIWASKIATYTYLMEHETALEYTNEALKIIPNSQIILDIKEEIEECLLGEE